MLRYDFSTDPTSYGTLEGNICLAPNTGYSVQPSTTEAPILVTLTEPVPTFGGPSTTVTTEGHTVTDLTMSTATRLETVTDSQLYCPPPLSAYGQACVTAGTNPFSTTATSATMSFNSTVTVTYTPPTTTSIRTASVATNTRGTTNPFGISLGGPATTITSGGSTITRYSASGGVLNSLTSTAAATATVAPYKGDAAGRVGGAVGGVAAVGAAALWLL